jgi:hypothetical protein
MRTEAMREVTFTVTLPFGSFDFAQGRPWFRRRIPGYREYLVLRITVKPLRIWARRHPPAPGTPADVARAMQEIGR